MAELSRQPGMVMQMLDDARAGADQVEALAKRAEEILTSGVLGDRYPAPVPITAKTLIDYAGADAGTRNHQIYFRGKNMLDEPIAAGSFVWAVTCPPRQNFPDICKYEGSEIVVFWHPIEQGRPVMGAMGIVLEDAAPKSQSMVVMVLNHAQLVREVREFLSDAVPVS